MPRSYNNGIMVRNGIKDPEHDKWLAAYFTKKLIMLKIVKECMDAKLP